MIWNGWSERGYLSQDDFGGLNSTVLELYQMDYVEKRLHDAASELNTIMGNYSTIESQFVEFKEFTELYLVSRQLVWR